MYISYYIGMYLLFSALHLVAVVLYVEDIFLKSFTVGPVTFLMTPRDVRPFLILIPK